MLSAVDISKIGSITYLKVDTYEEQLSEIRL